MATPISGNNHFTSVRASVPRRVPKSALLNALGELSAADPLYVYTGTANPTASAAAPGIPYTLLNEDGNNLVLPAGGMIHSVQLSFPTLTGYVDHTFNLSTALSTAPTIPVNAILAAPVAANPATIGLGTYVASAYGGLINTAVEDIIILQNIDATPTALGGETVTVQIVVTFPLP